jgi:ubiquinone/menaquinone biosynthesis C-methylase UbiE
MFHSIKRFLFKNFYHTFAWTYDFIAELVSIGRWNEWIQSIIPDIRGDCILEIGHGPGHLQELLMNEKRIIIGLDESRQMGRITKRRLGNAGHFKFNLTRARTESLPFAENTFDTVFSTFPTEYIFDSQTLSAVNRVLHKGGRLIILPAAWITGLNILDKIAGSLFIITGQSPTFSAGIVSEQIKSQFEKAGFKTDFKIKVLNSSIVLIVIAGKPTGI